MKRTWMVVLCSWLGAGAALGDQLDLSRPDDAVKAMRKIVCSLEDGEPVVFWWTGNVFSRVPGERDRLLFDYQGMNIRACATLEEPERGYGYRQVSREVLIYLDPASGEILRTWQNPWTGEEVEVVHIANDPVNMRPTFARGPRGPYHLPATFRDGRGWMTFEIPLFYPNPLGGRYQEYVGGTYQAIEMFGFFFDQAELLDPESRGLLDTNVSWARMAQWLPWMKMGGRAGQVMYHGAGKRLASWEELPDLLKEEIERNYPAYRTPPPLDDDRPNETSWTYFKKKVDAERHQGPGPEGP